VIANLDLQSLFGRNLETGDLNSKKVRPVMFRNWTRPGSGTRPIQLRPVQTRLETCSREIALVVRRTLLTSRVRAQLVQLEGAEA
jgi:hypothetical protein